MKKPMHLQKNGIQNQLSENIDTTPDLLPFWGTIKKSPSALQKAQLSMDLLAVYLHVSKSTYAFHDFNNY